MKEVAKGLKTTHAKFKPWVETRRMGELGKGLGIFQSADVGQGGEIWHNYRHECEETSRICLVLKLGEILWKGGQINGAWTERDADVKPAKIAPGNRSGSRSRNRDG